MHGRPHHIALLIHPLAKPHRPEWRDALEGYIFRDGDKAAATAGMLSFPPWPRMLREVLVCLVRVHAR